MAHLDAARSSVPARAEFAALYAEAKSRGAFFDLSARAKWRLTGADRVRYLNGQVTNDIRRAGPDSAMAACVTTAKGKLCGVIYLSAAADFIRIDADAALRESLGARLERYIIADDAALEDTTEGECLFHFVQVNAPALPELPAGVEVRAATRFGQPGRDVLGPAGSRTAILDALAGTAVLIPDALAESMRIEAGIPQWGSELTEDTLPPEAGLEETMIDYHKGCYIGQEVISRIRSVGRVNRQLVGITSASPLTVGMTLHPAGEPDKIAGQITSAAWSFGLDCHAALGYLKRGFTGIPLLAGPGVEVEIRALVP